jgi:hypothetical protein
MPATVPDDSGTPDPRTVDARPVDDHHDLVPAGHDLVDLGYQALPGLALQRPPQLVPAVAGLRLRILECRIEIGPLQFRVDELQHACHIAAAIGLICLADQGLVPAGHDHSFLSPNSGE